MSDDAPATPRRSSYEVGYGKPPAGHRFRKGVSGNPNGRPRGGTKPKPSGIPIDRAKDLLLEEAYRPVMLREGDSTIELPAIQAVFRAMGVAALKGNRFTQKALAELVASVEAERAQRQQALFEAAIEYKLSWQREFARCKASGLPEPAPIPHPDDIIVDARNGTAKFAGPMTAEEKEFYELVASLLMLLQVEVTQSATAAKRARSPERRAEHMRRLHEAQRQFDQYNDVVGPRYQRELRDRSYEPGATRPGDFARKAGIEMPGRSRPTPVTPEVTEMIREWHRATQEGRG